MDFSFPVKSGSNPVSAIGMAVVKNEGQPDFTGNIKSKMAAYKLVVSIKWLADEIEGHFQRQNPVFQMSSNSPKKNCDNLNQTGSRNRNMAASKPEIPIFQLPDEIETIFQRINLHFRVPAIEWG